MDLLLRNRGAMIFLMLNLFLAMAAFGLVVPVMPEYINMLGLDGTTAGLLTAAFAVTQFLFSPYAGKLSDRGGRKKIIVIGMLILAISELIFAVASNVAWLYISRLLGGIGIAFVSPAVMAYTADLTTERERARGMSYVAAALSTGFIIGPGIGGFLAEFGTRVPFYAAAAGAGAAAILTLFVLPEIKGKAEQMNTENEVGIFKGLTQSIKAPYVATLIVLLALGFALSNFETVFGLYLDDSYGYSASQIAVIITVGGIAGIVVQLGLMDLLVRKLGEYKVILYSLLVTALSIPAIILTDSYWGIMIVSIIIFSACDILRPAASTYLSKQADDNDQGYVAGLNSSYNSIGTIIGAALAGVLFDTGHTLPYIAAGFILLICFAYFAAKRNAKPKKAKAK